MRCFVCSVGPTRVYDEAMQRVSVTLDPAQLRAAQRVLGTTTAADTVRRAVDEVAAREPRRGIRDIPMQMTMDDLRRMRGTDAEHIW